MKELQKNELMGVNGGLGDGEEWAVSGAVDGGINCICTAAGCVYGFFKGLCQR